jgi:hypothetical protein
MESTTPEQINLPLETELVPVSFITENKEIISDFFGDHRDVYDQLVAFSKNKGAEISLHSQDIGFESEDDDVYSPLDPVRITQERAAIISDFFTENPSLSALFMEYSQGDY